MSSATEAIGTSGLERLASRARAPLGWLLLVLGVVYAWTVIDAPIDRVQGVIAGGPDALTHAIEGAEAGIRSNAVNADRIRTRLLDEADVAKRAQARGLDVDAYFRSNLLQRTVTADDVADAFVYLAGAHSTTGCVITVASVRAG